MIVSFSNLVDDNTFDDGGFCMANSQMGRKNILLQAGGARHQPTNVL